MHWLYKTIQIFMLTFATHLTAWSRTNSTSLIRYPKKFIFSCRRSRRYTLQTNRNNQSFSGFGRKVLRKTIGWNDKNSNSAFKLRMRNTFISTETLVLMSGNMHSIDPDRKSVQDNSCLLLKEPLVKFLFFNILSVHLD